jgi:hypothetical protein
MRKLLLYLIRLATIVAVLIGLIAALPAFISLYFMVFEGAKSGEQIFPDAFILPSHYSLAMLGIVALLFWGAYVADRFAVARLRALA